MLVGTMPPLVSAVAIVALLGQPGLTLRLAAHVRSIPRAVLAGATIAWALTALPFAVLGESTPRPVLLAAVAVFVITEGAAAAYLAGAARHRAGAAAIRLWIAAAATALFAVAILASGAGSAVEGATEAGEAVGRLLALLAAIGYLVAFVPPAFLRRIFQAQTAYGGLRELLASDGGATSDVWRAFLGIAIEATGASAGLVAGGPDEEGRRIAMVAGLDTQLIGRPVFRAPEALGSGEVTLDAYDGLGGFADAVAGARDGGARFGQSVRLGPTPDAPTVVLFSSHRSLFGEEDRLLLTSLGQQAAGLVERREAILAREGLADRLSSTVEALRSASQAKSDFLASMSHGLRTPLNAIIGFSDLMRREPSDEAGNVLVPLEWVEHIRRGGTHLVELVNDVLDLSKVEAGRLELDRESIEVLPAVAESVAGLRPLADRKGQAIDLAIAPGEHVGADRGRLRQVLYNLLSNAIKFTPEGGRITIEGARNGNRYHLSVVDTGVGIAPEDQAVVFHEFRQVGGGGQRSEGSGLGLALTRRLVEAHGGRIELESTPGTGSRFTVVLPAAEVDEQVAQEARLPADAITSLPAVAASSSVLVVEDDPRRTRRPQPSRSSSSPATT